MADTVKIPGAGHVSKKNAYVIGGVVAVAIGVYYYRNRSASATVTPGSVDPSTIDPATGLPYGSTGDQSALDALGNAGFPVGNTGGSTTGPNGGTNQNYTSNAQWSQAAIGFLSDTVGTDSETLTRALGKYLSGQGVTDAEVALINEAIAIAGAPPVAGTGGFPPQIRHVVTPKPRAKLAQPILSAKLERNSKTSYRLSWGRVSNAKTYEVHSTSRGLIARTNNTGTLVHNHRTGERYFVVATNPGGNFANSANSNFAP